MTAREKTIWAAVLFGLSLSSYAAYQQFKLPPVMPRLLDLYAYEKLLAGGFMSVYAFVGLLLSFAIGRLVDGQGVRRALTLALLVSLAGNLLILAWPSDGLVVLIGRGLEGIAFAACALVGQMLATRYASARHMPLIAGAMASWVPIGQLVAIVTAQPALRYGDWHWLWYMALALTVVLYIWMLTLERRRPGLLPGPRHSSHVDEGAPLAQMEIASLVLVSAIFLLWSGQYFAYMTWLPQFLVEAMGLSFDNAMLGYALPVVTLIVFNAVTGSLLKAGVPLPPLFLGGLLLQALCWWTLPWIGADWTGVLSLIIYGATAGVVPTVLWALPALLVGQMRASGNAFGIIMTGRNVGVLVGPMLLPWLLARSGDWQGAAPAFGTIVIVAFGLGLLVVMLMRRNRERAAR
ncbi:MFS transporter [Limibacillus sp. MBR-115]|jgi:MFS family permease|uniref:MFS transporter n=1 Tax=Limibacillus sp. MBR-115 TaxID=3156465 RepID=UPI0033958A78